MNIQIVSNVLVAALILATGYSFPAIAGTHEKDFKICEAGLIGRFSFVREEPLPDMASASRVRIMPSTPKRPMDEQPTLTFVVDSGFMFLVWAGDLKNSGQNIIYVSSLPFVTADQAVELRTLESGEWITGFELPSESRRLTVVTTHRKLVYDF